MEITFGTKLAFGKYKGVTVNNDNLKDKDFNSYLIWVHNNTHHTVKQEILDILYQFFRNSYDKLNNRSDRLFNKYAHSDDPYYIPGEDDL